MDFLLSPWPRGVKWSVIKTAPYLLSRDLKQVSVSFSCLLMITVFVRTRMTFIIMLHIYITTGNGSIFHIFYYYTFLKILHCLTLNNISINNISLYSFPFHLSQSCPLLTHLYDNNMFPWRFYQGLVGVHHFPLNLLIKQLPRQLLS